MRQVEWSEVGGGQEGRTPQGRQFRLFYSAVNATHMLEDPYSGSTYPVDSIGVGKELAESRCIDNEGFRA